MGFVYFFLEIYTELVHLLPLKSGLGSEQRSDFWTSFNAKLNSKFNSSEPKTFQKMKILKTIRNIRTLNWNYKTKKYRRAWSARPL